MNYIHVKNIEKFHPGYKDRKLQWMKMYFDMVQGDPEFEMITSETDKWRFISIVVLELQAQKPLPIDDEYFKRKGFDIENRSISMTLKMLHNFLNVVTLDEKLCSVEEDKEEDKEEDNIYTPIFVFWNESKIKLHRKLTDKMKTKIRSALKDYDEEEIKQAISRYGKIVNGAEYFFNYIWGLDEFLPRGLSKFDNDVCFKNYKEKKIISNVPAPNMFVGK